MPQLFSLYPDLTAGENVDFVASLFGLLLFRRRRRTRAVLELLGLWPLAGRRAKALSGGEQRRLELACALVHEPVLLILDEPTAGVDIGTKSEIIQRIRELADSGKAVIVISSELAELLAVSDRVLVLRNGTVTDDLDRRDIDDEESLQLAIQGVHS
jgi:ribose transport system ATP-binding protein